MGVWTMVKIIGREGGREEGAETGEHATEGRGREAVFCGKKGTSNERPGEGQTLMANKRASFENVPPERLEEQPRQERQYALRKKKSARVSSSMGKESTPGPLTGGSAT